MCGYGALRAPSRNFEPVMLLAMGLLIHMKRLGIFAPMLTGAVFHRRENHAGLEVHTCRALSEIKSQ